MVVLIAKAASLEISSDQSNKLGGRVYTYNFKVEKSEQGNHDYYDVGAMRFPDNDANKVTFDLFEELDLKKKLVPYVFTQDENFCEYNCERLVYESPIEVTHYLLQLSRRLRVPRARPEITFATK